MSSWIWSTCDRDDLRTSRGLTGNQMTGRPQGWLFRAFGLGSWSGCRSWRSWSSWVAFAPDRRPWTVSFYPCRVDHGNLISQSKGCLVRYRFLNWRENLIFGFGKSEVSLGQNWACCPGSPESRKNSRGQLSCIDFLGSPAVSWKQDSPWSDLQTATLFCSQHCWLWPGKFDPTLCVTLLIQVWDPHHLGVAHPFSSLWSQCLTSAWHLLLVPLATHLQSLSLFYFWVGRPVISN